MKILIITQARYGSSRLRGKVLKEINGKSMLDIHLQRLKRSKLTSDILVATTTEIESDLIIEVAKKNQCLFYKGSLNNVLERFYLAAKSYEPDIIIRVTSDCPLIDGTLIDDMITVFQQNKVDYLSNTNPPSFADGLDVEIFSFKTLELAWKEAKDLKELEHVTPHIHQNPQKFKLANYSNTHDQSALRLTVDTQEDFELICTLINQLGENQPWTTYVDFLLKNNDLQKLNNFHKRNEGY